MADSIWMMCLLLLVDGSTFSFATTPLILHYGKLHEPTLVAFLGGGFSAAGSTIQLLILRRLLATSHPYMKRFVPSQKKVESAIQSYPAASFLALVLARATPLPDAPLKLVAAAGGYPAGRYLLAIFLGALPYYFVLAIAGRKFQPPAWVLIAASVAIGTGLIVDRLRRRGREAE